MVEARNYRHLHFFSAHFAGCGGTCASTASCKFLHALHDTAVKKFHCQACLMPLKTQEGINMHPSDPGWKNCTFRLARFLFYFVNGS
jgi:hypothetical protein